MEGISNKTIVNIFAKKTSDGVKNVGVFPSNYMIRFISFHSMMPVQFIRSL